MHTKAVIRFNSISDIDNIIRSPPYCRQFHYGVVSVLVTASKAVLLTRGPNSGTLLYQEVQNTIRASSFIRFKSCGIGRWSRFVPKTYLKWIQGLALKCIKEEISNNAVGKELYNKTLDERDETTSNLLNELHLYYNEMFSYHAFYIFYLLKTQNKFNV